MTDKKPVILITGVSSGIGLALARLLWENENYRVVATARSESIKKLEGEPFENNSRFILLPLDVTVAAERQAVVSEVTNLWGGIDILINNAGVSFRAVIEHMTEADHTLQMSTNFLGPMDLIHLTIPGMRERGYGHIVNVSSVGGMMAMPTMGGYSASKFALEGASESLWYELKPWGVHVTLVQPGFIRSESFRNIILPELAQKDIEEKGPYANYYKHMECFVEKLMNSAFATEKDVAKLVLRIIKHKNPPLRVPATMDATFFGLLRRLLPRSIYHWLLYRNLPKVNEWVDNK